MTIASRYRKTPAWLGFFGAFVGSAVLTVAAAILSAASLNFLMDRFHHGDLVDALRAWFVVGPAIALSVFVLSFSVLANLHHSSSWQAPTFAFALGGILLWAWGHDWLTALPFVPGAVMWLICCWILLHRAGLSRSRPHHDQA